MEILDIEREIARVEQAKFLNAMNDHWRADDYAFDRKCAEELRILRAKLEEMNNGKA